MGNLLKSIRILFSIYIMNADKMKEEIFIKKDFFDEHLSMTDQSNTLSPFSADSSSEACDISNVLYRSRCETVE